MVPNIVREEIDYLMQCADTNKDGMLDYMEFTERFHTPAKNIGNTCYNNTEYVLWLRCYTFIGFSLCVLITNLLQRVPHDKRWVEITKTVLTKLL